VLCFLQVVLGIIGFCFAGWAALQVSVWVLPSLLKTAVTNICIPSTIIFFVFALVGAIVFSKFTSVTVYGAGEPPAITHASQHPMPVSCCVRSDGACACACDAGFAVGGLLGYAIYLVWLMPSANGGGRTAVLMLCVGIPGFLCAAAIVKVEKQIMIFVTAALGACMEIVGYDMLFKPHGRQHIQSNITPTSIKSDQILQVELATAMILMVVGAAFQWFALVRPAEKKRKAALARNGGAGHSMPLLAGAPVVKWQSDAASGRFVKPRGYSLTREHPDTGSYWQPPARSTPDAQRWFVGDSCEVYSKSGGQWTRGEVIGITRDGVLTIEYASRQQSMQKYLPASSPDVRRGRGTISY
jgi:hypothetical protein